MRNSRKDETHDEHVGEHEAASADTNIFFSSSVSQEVLEENKYTPTRKRILLLIAGLCSYVALNLIGALFFQLIEKKHNEDLHHWLPKIKREFLLNHSSCLTEQDLDKFLENLKNASKDAIPIHGNTITYADRWSFNNAFMLSFSIASTIGYGSVTPVTAGGQIFAVFFAIVSIPFTGILAAKLGIIMVYYLKKVAFSIAPSQRKRCACLCVTLIFGSIIYIFIPTLLLYFVKNEKDWSFVNCFYCVIISLTTIGFGDYVPDPSSHGGISALILVQLWVIAGLAWFASIIKIIAAQMSSQVKSLKKKVEVSSPAMFSKIHGASEILKWNHSRKSFARSLHHDSNKCPSSVRKKRAAANSNDMNADPPEIELSDDEAETNGPGSFHAVMTATLSSC